MSDADLSGSSSDNDQNIERHITTKGRHPSDSEGIEHPAVDIDSDRDNDLRSKEDVDVKSDSDDRAAKSDKGSSSSDSDNERDTRRKSPRMTSSDSSDDNDAKESVKTMDSESENEEKVQKPKKRRSKKEEEDDTPISKEAQELVKSVTKGNSVQYIKRNKDDEKERINQLAREILKGIEKALKDDEQSYLARRPPFERVKYLKVLEGHLKNQKLAKALINSNLIDYLAALLSPFEKRPDDDKITYPNDSFRQNVLKIILSLDIKKSYLEDSNKLKRLIDVITDMPLPRGSELEKVAAQTINKLLRLITKVDEKGDDNSKTTIDKDEVSELKMGAKNEKYSDINLAVEKKMLKMTEKYRRSNVEIPRDYVPPPRIISKDVKQSKRRL